MTKKETLIAEIEEIFDRYNYRDDIEQALRNIGFEKWANLSKDEEIWAYDKGTPNGEVLVLINWIDVFVWIFEKIKTIKL